MDIALCVPANITAHKGQQKKSRVNLTGPDTSIPDLIAGVEYSSSEL
jgi:hypothetical protein